MPEVTSALRLLPIQSLAAALSCACFATAAADENMASAAPAVADPMQSVTIGPRDEVGKESLGDKAAKGVIGAFLGGSKGRSQGPRTRKDPTRKIDYTMQEKAAADLEVGTRAHGGARQVGAHFTVAAAEADELESEVEELAELNEENASALQELARRLGEAADGISGVAGQAGELGRIDEDVKDAAEKAQELAGILERLGNAMEVIDAVMRADELTPSQKLEAMSKAFEEFFEWLPELPGVSEMLEFYNEAMKAIAGKLAEIEDVQIKQWTDLVEAGIADPDDAPIGIREEVRKAAHIRELMKIVTRNCGNPPTPPAAVLYDAN